MAPYTNPSTFTVFTPVFGAPISGWGTEIPAMLYQVEMGSVAGLLQVLRPWGGKEKKTLKPISISQGASYLLLSCCHKPVILSSDETAIYHTSEK